MDQTHAFTSSRILPALALLSMRAWASATASSGKRLSMTGRRAPAVEQRQHLGGEALGDGDLLLERPRPQHRADDAGPLAP